MHVTERQIGDITIVDVSGKVTLGDGGDVVLKDKMASLVQQGHKKVLLNLGDVSYVDSAGLGAIVQSYATMNKNGGNLKLLNTTKRIKDLLSITNLLRLGDDGRRRARRLVARHLSQHFAPHRENEREAIVALHPADRNPHQIAALIEDAAARHARVSVGERGDETVRGPLADIARREADALRVVVAEAEDRIGELVRI